METPLVGAKELSLAAWVVAEFASFWKDSSPFWNRERLIFDLDLLPWAVPRLQTTAGQKFVASLQSPDPIDKVH